MSLAQKLQIKAGQSVVVLYAPQAVKIELEGSRTVSMAAAADAMVVFAANRAELLERADPLVEAARRDALAWIAYPKAGQLGTDLNRDSVWKLLEDRGIRPVRQVAIDDVWSALRFRPA